MNFIFDTSATVALIETCRLETSLLEFSENHRLFVSQQVKEEYLAGERAERNILVFERVFESLVVSLDQRLLPYFHFDESCGEISVISHAIRNPDCCCVIDEEYARRICELFDVALTGTVGILLKLRDAGLVSRRELRTVRKRLQNSRFFLSKRLLKQIR
jgi:predicted nucleic acid-binding protein